MFETEKSSLQAMVKSAFEKTWFGKLLRIITGEKKAEKDMTTSWWDRLMAVFGKGKTIKDEAPALSLSGPESPGLYVDAKFHSFIPFASFFSEAASKYGVPEGILVKLAQHENPKADPTAKNPFSSAYGLGQMIDDTWECFKEKGADRNNPKDQVMAMASYLSNIARNKRCTWERAMVYYHTGEGGVTDKTLAKVKKANPAIVALMKDDSPGGYMEAAERFYGA